MHRKIHIKNATLVNEDRSFVGSLVIEDDTIAEILEGGAEPAAPADEVVDATGCYLLPGVIDTHVHFRDPGLTDKADLDSESRAAAAGGVTTFFDMPNTLPQTEHITPALMPSAVQVGPTASDVTSSCAALAISDSCVSPQNTHTSSRIPASEQVGSFSTAPGFQLCVPPETSFVSV